MEMRRSTAVRALFDDNMWLMELLVVRNLPSTQLSPFGTRRPNPVLVKSSLPTTCQQPSLPLHDLIIFFVPQYQTSLELKSEK